MSKKKRTSLIIALAVLAVLVAATVYLFLSEPEKKEDPAAIKVSQISSSTVTSMRIIEEDGHVVEVEKRADGWYYPGETETALDQSNMESALTIVCYLFAKGTVEGHAEDLSVYGLDPARMRVEYTLEDGSEHWVAFGGYSSDRESIYMCYEGSDEVYLYAPDSYSILERAAAEMTDLSIGISADALAKIEMMRISGKKPVIMEKIPEEARVGMESWMLREPFGSIANAEAVNLVKAFFSPARYAAYAAAEATKEHGFDESQAYLYLEEEDGTSVRIEIGAQTENGRYYCREEGREGVYELAAGFSTLLTVKDENLIPSVLFPTNEEYPAELIVERDGEIIYIAKPEGNRYNINDTQIDEEQTKIVLQYIQNFACSGIAGEKTPGEDAEYVITLKNGDRELQYSFYTYKNDFLAVETERAGNTGGYVKKTNMETLLSVLEKASKGEAL